MSNTSGDQFITKAGTFEGPLQLLISLIERRKMHISEVSLAQVTDDFIEYIRNFEHFSIPDIANFIVAASTLMLIKARSLLPSLEITEHERGDIENMEYRLRLLQIFRHIGDKHISLADATRRIAFRTTSGAKSIAPQFFAPTSGQLTPRGLASAIRGVIESLPKIEQIPQATVRRIVSIEEVMTRLVSRIQKNLRISFQEFHGQHNASTKEGRMNIVLGFLAILELIRRGAVLVNQRAHRGDIIVESANISTPHYG
ncbi:MAG: segregation/condensation protein A [Candidatus Vogelbacteria bacterium]|nr:segregation/condensation protein A [Candidatus Vogelbacteria bacterium]